MATLTVPGTVPADYGRDVTADLQAIIDGATDGDIIRCQPWGQYRVDGTLDLSGRSLEIRGNGATFRRWADVTDREAAHITADTPGTLTIRRLTIHGNAGGTQYYPRGTIGYDATREAQHGINVLACAHLTLIGFNVRNIWGDKVYLGKNSADVWCDDVRISESAGGWSHRHSIGISGARNVSSENNSWGSSWRSGVDLEPNDAAGGYDSVTFSGDTWDYHRLNWIASSAAAGTGTDLFAIDCYGTTSPLSVDIAGAMTHNGVTIDNCESLCASGGPSGACMNLHNVANVIVTNNTQPLQAGRTPPMRVARFYDASDVELTLPHAGITYTGNTADLG